MYARPFEQIRNDVCLHRLPVVLVGNGGGYGYGVMGATHHALEDYGSLLCLPHLRAYVPAFDSDISNLVDTLLDVSGPAYLRLGVAEEPRDAAVSALRALAKASGRTRLADRGDRAARGQHLGSSARPRRTEAPLAMAPERAADP